MARKLFGRQIFHDCFSAEIVSAENGRKHEKSGMIFAIFFRREWFSSFVMACRFPSRAWSCGDLISGVAMVVDNAASTKKSLQEAKDGFLVQAEGLDAATLEQMLKDIAWKILNINNI